MLAPHLSNQRFDHYPDWLKHVSSARAFIYVPLSTSIGLNNIIPAAIANTRIFAYKLSPPTSQHKLYSYLGARVTYFSSTSELQQQLLESEPSCRYETNRSTYITKLPTPKVFLKSIINRSGNLFEQLSPSNLDPRYTQLCQLSQSLSTKQYFDFVSFYEHLQFLYEYLRIFPLFCLYLVLS